MNILNKEFQYTPSHKTDISKRWRNEGWVPPSQAGAQAPITDTVRYFHEESGDAERRTT